jgi:pyruvate ferredoxin oxidoreductase gamma subunit/2-oxoisovalerate ferredoxin oxidoreductase gamma subunit
MKVNGNPMQGGRMQEIRFHGRGGQGTVVAGVLLAKAFFEAGYFVQSFPLFGVERRGAPVEAFLRLDRSNILIRSNVYTPNHVVVQDAKLLNNIDVTRGLQPGGTILINTPAPPADRSRFGAFRLAVVDATGIAIRNRLGTSTHPIINTAVVGAFARVFEAPPLETLISAIAADIRIQTEANVNAAREAHAAVRVLGTAPQPAMS